MICFFQGYYKRTPDYFPILKREKIGCFEVPMVHSVYLIDLQYYSTDNLQYYPAPEDYHGEVDDILIFAFSARKSGLTNSMLPQLQFFAWCYAVHNVDYPFALCLNLNMGTMLI